MIVVIQLAGV